jgi:hypothetical protein
LAKGERELCASSEPEPEPQPSPPRWLPGPAASAGGGCAGGSPGAGWAPGQVAAAEARAGVGAPGWGDPGGAGPGRSAWAESIAGTLRTGGLREPRGGSRWGVGGGAPSVLVVPTFLASGVALEPATYSDCSQDGGELPRPCPPGQLGPGTRLGQAAGGSPGTRPPRATPDGGTLALRPGRARQDCPGCGEVLEKPTGSTRYDGQGGDLRVGGLWWHRGCWLARAPAREEALRSQREAVGRRLAVADYLLAQKEWGGLPAIVSGPILVPSYAGRGANVAADNRG